eukprot:gnl/MRDRNA2_/MRDRNA2_289250_c0_seq1.p1 gnl/MRDRNA2_/MRDRNA2_289250_c0~~gnl/MRDRNA2_/MRDRNA2_289250_c0_seq1.p1  ORF type:complete len:141 (+),score=21.60 gnl/MRDRNA2_/MRDRNA2_289250_c0_seq1:76-498(+)
MEIENRCKTRCNASYRLIAPSAVMVTGTAAANWPQIHITLLKSLCPPRSQHSITASRFRMQDQWKRILHEIKMFLAKARAPRKQNIFQRYHLLRLCEPITQRLITQRLAADDMYNYETISELNIAQFMDMPDNADNSIKL